MKIIGSNKTGKTIKLSRVDIQLKLSEIDNIIDFLQACKDAFNSRQQDCSIQRIVMKDEMIDYEKLTKYKAIKAIGSELIDCELHYADWCEEKRNLETDKDIVIHTPFKAKEKEDGTFTWENVD